MRWRKKLSKFDLHVPMDNIVAPTTPVNKVYFINVQEAPVRGPAMLKKRELCAFFPQNLVMTGLLPHFFVGKSPSVIARS